MAERISLSSHTRMSLIEEKSQGHHRVNQLLTSLLVGNKMKTGQVNAFLTSCAHGKELLAQFEVWCSDNQENDFEKFALAQI